MLLKDRNAIITGGARGIGKGIALKFAENGCSVIIVDLLEMEAEKVVSEILEKGARPWQQNVMYRKIHRSIRWWEGSLVRLKKSIFLSIMPPLAPPCDLSRKSPKKNGTKPSR